MGSWLVLAVTAAARPRAYPDFALFLSLIFTFLLDVAQDAAYEPLHDAHAKDTVDIILRLKGFYIKVCRQRQTRVYMDSLPSGFFLRLAHHSSAYWRPPPLFMYSCCANCLRGVGVSTPPCQPCRQCVACCDILHLHISLHSAVAVTCRVTPHHIEMLFFALSQIGQLASTRADFLPRQYYERVKTLQSDTPSEPLDYIRQVDSGFILCFIGQELL